MAQRKQLKRAMSVFSKGERKELMYIRLNMINAFVRCSKLDLALELYRQMKQHKLKPNVVTYTIEIKVRLTAQVLTWQKSCLRKW